MARGERAGLLDRLGDDAAHAAALDSLDCLRMVEVSPTLETGPPGHRARG